MKTLRVYLDTSVVGGCFDPEFALWSRALMDDFRAGLFRPVLSELLAAELDQAPAPVRELYGELMALADAPVPVTPEALDLLARYTAHAIVGPRFRNDMLHIALATVADVDVVVSWNFRHIVHLEKIRAFNAVNLEAGYKSIAIHSPREVTSHGADQEPAEGR